MTTLQPCPFCGSKELEVKQIQNSRNEAVYFVRCLGECECEGPVEFLRDNAKQKWNERAERRWIPVEERLPEVDLEVLVTWGKTAEVAWRRLHNDDWVAFAPLGKVTHWMPLPQMPEKEVQG